ncbi:Coxsackievirus and adenovirus receptor-like protein [Nibea albiflora]|uniref:Coxsackievirus and adenovirus receptor-like protein n=1 Tax=Nibea albiflora TaxID=240163 RepID=A0ACB7FHC6_NIBAL|nr:Coxsackievirus and adenovirus receptor-like protein [Nibea albiflora]
MDKQFFLLLIVGLMAKGLEINTSNNKFVEKAVGENVKLDCFFTTGPEDEGMLEIEWSMKSMCHPMEKAEVLLYTAENIYNNLYEHLKGRVYFDAQDPQQGDAAIHLSQLTRYRHLLLPVLDQTAGRFQRVRCRKCIAINRDSQEKCILKVNLPYPPSVEIIAGSVAGAVATIGIIAYLTYFTIQGRRRELENSNEIVEDASPPKPRKMMQTKRQLNRSQPPL